MTTNIGTSSNLPWSMQVIEYMSAEQNRIRFDGLVAEAERIDRITDNYVYGHERPFRKHLPKAGEPDYLSDDELELLWFRLDQINDEIDALEKQHPELKLLDESDRSLK
ncbi:Hypothetical protein D9617_31g063790 [Elsinoe fawcettii]|nr:Hypothetical protein D9617_31g063790 [Elsinoe fawcettii]